MKTAKVGDKVIFDEMLAIVTGVRETDAGLRLDLEAIGDKEMTCTVYAQECDEWDGEDYDNEPRLRQARMDSALIAHQVDSITDKYYGDGSY